MIKIYILTLILLQTQSQEETGQFIGCTSDLFPNPGESRVSGVDFSSACTILETCANTFSSSKTECLQNFEKNQNDVCSSITQLNLFRKRYCYRVADTNMEIANDLEDSIFDSKELAFTATISDDGTNCIQSRAPPGSCDNPNAAPLQPFDAPTATCDNTENLQKLKFYLLSNGKFVIGDSHGKCLNFEAIFDFCNFDNEEQWMLIEASSETGTIQNVIVNKDDELLSVEAATGPAVFNDTAENEVIISVIIDAVDDVIA